MKHHWPIILVSALVLVGCRPDDQKTSSIETSNVKSARAQLAPAVVMQLDSGNAAFKRKDYDLARTRYQAAVAADESVAAGWFGLYMTQVALKDSVAAEASLKRAQKLAPGATLIHPRPDRATRHP
jgi:Tfp pilus assembly protein PilF